MPLKTSVQAAARLAIDAALAAAPATAQTAKIDGGTLRGTRTGDLEIYNGIPYAAPPVAASLALDAIAAFQDAKRNASSKK